MCGIFVIDGKHGHLPYDKSCKSLVHRGPDDFGSFFDEKAVMLHTRLSIIDLAGGKQPIFNEKGDKCIICNGEIYNYSELKSELKNKHRFSTNSDTEIILHLYEDFGSACLENLNGMFAFAIYDNGSLFIARDRLGIKPLYYGYIDNSIVFASELKSLKMCLRIYEFPPGHYYISKKGFESYYKICGANEEYFDEEDLCRMLREKLSESVKKRMMSDVPIGVFLSGGIDSSIIAALMKENTDRLYSFSVGIKDSEDLKAARIVAQYLKTEHYEYVFSESEMIDIIDEVIYYLESFDAPLVRSSIPNYFVAKLAKKYVKVVLTGEGADELFCGYNYLKKIKEDKQLKREILRLIGSLHNINLQRTDRMTMAHSIEARVPFLDHEFVEFALKIPMRLKKTNSSRIEKYILRKAFESYLPDEIIWREKLKFSEGTGFEGLFKKISEKRISDSEFLTEKRKTNMNIRGKDELFFYKIYHKLFSYLEDFKLSGVTLDF
ncbi:MAG: asparagine synthase B [Chlorobi bacterium]|nr:asparagine synthase B [Chlorobiota bacterium]